MYQNISSTLQFVTRFIKQIFLRLSTKYFLCLFLTPLNCTKKVNIFNHLKIMMILAFSKNFKYLRSLVKELRREPIFRKLFSIIQN